MFLTTSEFEFVDNWVAFSALKFPLIHDKLGSSRFDPEYE